MVNRITVTVLIVAGCIAPAAFAEESSGVSQRDAVVQFLRKHVLGKVIAEASQTVVIKDGELEADTLVTRKITNLVVTPHGFYCDILTSRKQTDHDLGPDGKRTGISHVKDGTYVVRLRVGERLSSGALFGIADELYTGEDLSLIHI